MFAFALVGTAMAGTPSPVRWSDEAFPIKYWVGGDFGAAGLDEAAAIDEIEQAFDEWGGVDCFDGFFVGPSDDRVKNSSFGEDPDHRNTVFIVTHGWPSEFAGLPTATKLVLNGNEIQEADIGLNAQDFQFAVKSKGHKALDLQSALTHEIGHLLGLPDSTVEGATMNPDMIGRLAGRSLDEKSDWPALCDLYPPMTDTGIPPHSHQGDECTSVEDCTDGFVCVVDNGDQYCAERCGPDGECSTGTTCEDPGSGAPVCVLVRETTCGVVPPKSAGFVVLGLVALAIRRRTRR